MKNRLLIISFITLLLAPGCGPVSIFTTFKKAPHGYLQNSPADGIHAPAQDQYLKPWIVYSDRSNNAAFIKAGSSIKSNEFGLGEPFLVIGKKGEYLQLIRYNPNHHKTKRFTERKAAQYIGWTKRSNLLLSCSAITDSQPGPKAKMLTVISDTIALMQPARFFKEADSLLVFKTPGLLDTCTIAAGVHQIVYVLKNSPDGNNSLICHTPDITPEKAKEQIIGWIPNVMLQNIGQQVFAKINLPKEIKQPDALKYSPVLHPHFTDSAIIFNSGILLPILDKSKNFLYNINGEAISFNQAEAVKNDLQHINILFAFEAGFKLPEQFPPLLHVIQNLYPMFASVQNRFKCRFGAVIASDNQPKTIGLTTDYSRMADSLASFTTKISVKSQSIFKPWSALETSLKILAPCKDQTNIIIVFGERGDPLSELAPRHIPPLLSQLNCRLLGVQIYACDKNISTNFVLQLTNMIEKYAADHTINKRNMIFFANQFCRKNIFREFGDNFYALNNSPVCMSQGGVLFPEKGEQIQLERIAPAIDTLFKQIIFDNTLLSKNIDSAFLTMGNTADKYNPLLCKQFDIPYDTTLNSHFKKLYNGKNPIWYASQQQITIPRHAMQYRLLLNEPELKQLLRIMESLCSYAYPMRISSKKARNNLIKFYLSIAEQYRPHQTKRNVLKQLSLAQAHKHIFGPPSNLPLLHNITIQQLKNKTQFTDSQLEALIRYFKLCKEKLAENQSAEKINSASGTYYYINSRLLP
ncbi:MAG: type VI secretion system protein TssR [Bacteroidales bacterium]